MMLHHDPTTWSHGLESASLSFTGAAAAATPLSLPRRIAAIAAAQPESVALVAPCGTLTYGELERQAQRLAGHLAWSGVRAESIVAIALPRSFERIVALLAVMK